MTTGTFKLKPGERLGDYIIIDVLGPSAGGMSRVMKAQIPGNPDTAALKVSRTGPEARYFFAAIHREVEILRQISHPGIVQLRRVSGSTNPYKTRAVGLHGAPWYFGMEFLEGGSLAKYLVQVGTLYVSDGIGVSLCICDALLRLHENGYVHNDVKPENVLFRTQPLTGSEYTPVLVDFGIAGSVHKLQHNGSLAYMAPERLRSRKMDGKEDFRRQCGGKSDVWSMGVLMYRLFSGKEPFLHISDRSMADRILGMRPRRIIKTRPDIPVLLEEMILEGCLAKDPAFRVDMQELFSFLSAYSPSGIVEQRRPQGLIDQFKNYFAVGAC